MKNPSSLYCTGFAVVCCLGIDQTASAQGHNDFNTSAIYESYDQNPLGEMVGKPSGGYGVAGSYNNQGGSSAQNIQNAKDAFQIVNGGLEFGSYNSTAGRSIQVISPADGSGTGVGIQVDGGKPWGDTDLNVFDTLYCSYLVKFTQVSDGLNARALVRTSGASSGGDEFQIHADGVPVAQGAISGGGTANTGKIQPAMAYKGTVWDRAVDPVTNSLSVGQTYMMIGRFNNTGNVLSVATTGSWNSGESAITVTSATNIAPGQLVTGTGIAADSMVLGISGTVVTLNKPTIAAGPTGTSLNFGIIVNSVENCVANYAPAADTAVTTTTFTTITTMGPLAVGMVATGPNIPANTTITAVTQAATTTITLSSRVTNAVTNGTVTFRSLVPLNATWSSAASTITLNKDPGVQIGMAVIGAGIQPNTLIQSVSGTSVTLNKPTTAPGSATSVHVMRRTASCSLFALSLSQYNYMIGRSDQPAKDLFLDTAAMGTASDQVTVRIVGTPTTSGSIEFGQGRYIHLIAQGNSDSVAATIDAEKYQMDELRFGFTLKSVTQPATRLSVPAGDPAAFDDGSPRYYYPFDNGYGWKSGFYEVEETASPKGAILINSNFGSGAELTPGSGDYLYVEPRFSESVDQGTRRRPDPAVVDMSKPYTVNFDFQMKSDPRTFTAFEDRFQFGADGQITSTNVPIPGSNLGPNPSRPNLTASTPVGGTNLSWLVGVVGADGGRKMVPGKWYFQDFIGASIPNSSPPNYFYGDNLVVASDDDNSQPGPNTDRIPSIVTGDAENSAGGIYSFKIEVNPQTYTYRGTITYRPQSNSSPVDIKTYTKGGLRFRENANADTLFWGISKSTGENRIFALDNIRVSPGVDFFPDWVGAYSALGDKTRSADPDNDGRKNFLEYALDGDPSKGTASGKEFQSVTTIASNQYHSLTVPIRSGLTFSAAASPNTGDLESTFTNNEGIKYRVEGSFDLVNWNATVVEVSPALASTPALSASPGYAYKSFRLAQPISTGQPKGFLRMVVDSTK